jgi:hypothetical protein
VLVSVAFAYVLGFGFGFVYLLCISVFWVSMFFSRDLQLLILHLVQSPYV